MYDDDLTTLMHDTTDGLRPPVGAASVALRSAARHRRRTAVAAGGSGLAVAGLIGAGLSQLPARTAPTASIQVASGTEDSSSSPSACVESGAAQLNPTAAPALVDPVFAALTAPQTLPGYPVNMWASPAVDSYQDKDQRLFGWDVNGVFVSPDGHTVDGPGLRLDIFDAPGCFTPDANGRVDGRTVTGQRTVLNEPALISHGDNQVWLTLSTKDFSIQVQGDGDTTVDDLVMAVDSIQGLDTVQSAPSTPAIVAITASPSTTASADATPSDTDLEQLAKVTAARRAALEALAQADEAAARAAAAARATQSPSTVPSSPPASQPKPTAVPTPYGTQTPVVALTQSPSSS